MKSKKWLDGLPFEDLNGADGKKWAEGLPSPAIENKDDEETVTNG